MVRESVVVQPLAKITIGGAESNFRVYTECPLSETNLLTNTKCTKDLAKQIFRIKPACNVIQR